MKYGPLKIILDKLIMLGMSIHNVPIKIRSRGNPNSRAAGCATVVAPPSSVTNCSVL